MRVNGYEIKATANLQGADLRFSDLQGAGLQGANLRFSDLRFSDLRFSDLRFSDLRVANLRGANLRDANLRDANLRDANLRGANLQGANLQGANLRGANLRGANLRDANLRDANLRDADLRDADLQGASLQGTRGIPQTVVAPEGDLIGWKACRDGVIAKLRIPADARRSNATSRKCRAEFVDVLEVEGAEYGVGVFDFKVRYRPGERVHCHEWCEDRWKGCAGGIHFFLTREEAVEWGELG